MIGSGKDSKMEFYNILSDDITISRVPNRYAKKKEFRKLIFETDGENPITRQTLSHGNDVVHTKVLHISSVLVSLVARKAW